MIMVRACCVAENGKFVGKQMAWDLTAVDASIKALNEALVRCDPFSRHFFEEESKHLTVQVDLLESAA